MIAFWLVRPEWTAGRREEIIKLTADCCFCIDNIEYWIPSGYECDGASIPRGFWWIPGIGSPTEGFNAFGAWAHDALYLTHSRNRKEADEVAYQLWIQAGKTIWSAITMWASVRSAGALAWINSTEDKIELAKVCNMIKERTIEEQNKFKTLWPILY